MMPLPVRPAARHAPDLRLIGESARTEADLDIARQALRELWPLTEADRRFVMLAMLRILQSAADPIHAIQAARVILEADKLNMEEERRSESR